MQTVHQISAWFSKQKFIAKMAIGCSSLFMLCCICSVPIAILSLPAIVQTENPINIPAIVPTEQSTQETNAQEEKTFLFYGAGGKEISAYVYADTENPGSNMVIFTPYVDQTDGELYNASQNALWNIYGKERGLLQLDNAKTEYDDSLGGNAICWAIFNPDEYFCVFPIKDSGTESITALLVWTK